MKRETFKTHLEKAIVLAVDFTKTMVTNELPPRLAFNVYGSQSYNGNLLEGDEQLYPKDTRDEDDPLHFGTSDEVADYLWRNEKVPEWIDVNVESEDGEYTYITAGFITSDRN